MCLLVGIIISIRMGRVVCCHRAAFEMGWYYWVLVLHGQTSPALSRVSPVSITALINAQWAVRL